MWCLSTSCGFLLGFFFFPLISLFRSSESVAFVCFTFLSYFSPFWTAVSSKWDHWYHISVFTVCSCDSVYMFLDSCPLFLTSLAVVPLDLTIGLLYDLIVNHLHWFYYSPAGQNSLLIILLLHSHSSPCQIWFSYVYWLL